jgi:hypothetical protein
MLADSGRTAPAMATALRAYGCLSKAGIENPRAVEALIADTIASVAKEPPRPGPSLYDQLAAELLASPFLGPVGKTLARSGPDQFIELTSRTKGDRGGIIAATVFLLGASVPLVVYLVNPMHTPTRAEWLATGSNHGPWHYSLWGWAAALACVMLLGLVALGPMLGVRAHRDSRSRLLLLHGLGIGIAAAGVLALYAHFVLWAMD